uniref:Uncharacterized protein n=1 Tax=Nelumbo nucifera TaxID=4432 RepID=A0A822XZU6_NELNU|nr:TPA_asm: hypothetical protein HUJ06_027204 [Nelumbo nucifera]
MRTCHASFDSRVGLMRAKGIKRSLFFTPLASPSFHSTSRWRSRPSSTGGDQRPSPATRKKPQAFWFIHHRRLFHQESGEHLVIHHRRLFHQSGKRKGIRRTFGQEVKRRKVDNYMDGHREEIQVMDGSDNPLLTMRRKDLLHPTPDSFT